MFQIITSSQTQWSPNFFIRSCIIQRKTVIKRLSEQIFTALFTTNYKILLDHAYHKSVAKRYLHQQEAHEMTHSMTMPVRANSSLAFISDRMTLRCVIDLQSSIVPQRILMIFCIVIQNLRHAFQSVFCFNSVRCIEQKTIALLKRFCWEETLLYASRGIRPLSDWTLAIEVCSNGKASTDCLIWPFVRAAHSFL